MKKVRIQITVLLLCLTTILCYYLIMENKEIAEIYVYHSAFGTRAREYRIDIANKEVWKYTGDFTKRERRDASAPNEGYEFAKQLQDDEIERFLQHAAKYGLKTLKESYMNRRIVDGHQWGITVTFSDGTRRVSTGSNAYPKSWNELSDSLFELTGEDVLIQNSLVHWNEVV